MQLCALRLKLNDGRSESDRLWSNIGRLNNVDRLISSLLLYKLGPGLSSGYLSGAGWDNVHHEEMIHHIEIFLREVCNSS